MKKPIISAIALMIAAAPLVSHALSFDVRGGYKAGSHSYESRFKVSQSWSNGWWASMEKIGRAHV